jgi:hypothetical protein
VVICLHERRHPWTGSWYPRSDKLWEPPLPSSWNPRNPRTFRSPAKATELFGPALDLSLRSIRISQTDLPNGIWLAALIHLEAFNCAGWLDHINSQASIYDNADPKDQQQLSKQTADLCKTLQSDISQVIALQKTPDVCIRHSDYEGALLMLERLLGEARVIAADIRESLDSQHRDKNTQVAELAINESRSAIAGTLFLQISQNFADITNSKTLPIYSHCTCVYIHPNQPRVIGIWNERSRDKRNGP